MNILNEIKFSLPSKSCNESLARTVVSAFASQLDPSVSEIGEIKTAVSEAVTNAIIHGYESPKQQVELECSVYGDWITVVVTDYGIGIADIEKAKEPFFTTKPELERSGMGFAFMEAFMDEISVESEPGKGTTVHMRRKLQRRK